MEQKRKKKKNRKGSLVSLLRSEKKKTSTTKYKTLEEKVKKEFKQEGISAKNIQLIEPPDGVKMSAVILKLAEPLLKKHGDDDKRTEAIISMTIVEWNRLMLPEDEQKSFQDSMIDKLIPQDNDVDDAEAIESLLYISNLITKRKKRYFPDLKKLIVNYELIVSNSDITLNVASALMKS